MTSPPDSAAGHESLPVCQPANSAPSPCRDARYSLCFQMGALELQRQRKLTERRVALRRIQQVDKSLAKIDAQLDLLRSRLGMTPIADAQRISGTGKRDGTGVAQPRRGARFTY